MCLFFKDTSYLLTSNYHLLSFFLYFYHASYIFLVALCPNWKGYLLFFFTLTYFPYEHLKNGDLYYVKHIYEEVF